VLVENDHIIITQNHSPPKAPEGQALQLRDPWLAILFCCLYEYVVLCRLMRRSGTNQNLPRGTFSMGSSGEGPVDATGESPSKRKRFVWFDDSKNKINARWPPGTVGHDTSEMTGGVESRPRTRCTTQRRCRPDPPAND